MMPKDPKNAENISPCPSLRRGRVRVKFRIEKMGPGVRICRGFALKSCESLLLGVAGQRNRAAGASFRQFVTVSGVFSYQNAAIFSEAPVVSNQAFNSAAKAIGVNLRPSIGGGGPFVSKISRSMM